MQQTNDQDTFTAAASEDTDFTASAQRMSVAVESLDAAMTRVIQYLEAQQNDLGVKVDRIVAAIDDGATAQRQQLEVRIAELERANGELKAQSANLSERAARKTLPPLMTSLLAKSGVESDRIDAGTLEKTLASLSVEQRIAVKAELARAGFID